MKKLSLALATASALAFGGAAFAQETMPGMDMSGMDMSGPMGGFMAAMNTMMQNMPKESSGNPDADFLLMMIPHHQSAIDMARVQLEQGTDEETRALAQEIIDAQESEIAEMRTMLERMGVTPPPAAN